MRKKISVNTVRNCRALMHLCDPAAAPADGVESTERPPRGSRTKWEFAFEDWSQNQLPAESLQASSWKVFLCK